MPKCKVCGGDVPNERVDLIGEEICIKCAPPTPKLFGVMEYSGKNVGTLVVTDDPVLFRQLKKPANRRR